MGKQGVGVARIRGLAILVKNTNPGDKVMIRITKIKSSSATAEVVHKILRSKAVLCCHVLWTTTSMSTNTAFEHALTLTSLQFIQLLLLHETKPLACRDQYGNVLYRFMHPQTIPFEYSSAIVAEYFKYCEVLVCHDCMKWMI